MREIFNTIFCEYKTTTQYLIILFEEKTIFIAPAQILLFTIQSENVGIDDKISSDSDNYGVCINQKLYRMSIMNPTHFWKLLDIL